MQYGDSEEIKKKSIQKSKMVENLTGILLSFKQHLFQHIYSIDKNLGGMRQALEKLRIAKITHLHIKDGHASTAILEFFNQHSLPNQPSS